MPSKATIEIARDIGARIMLIRGHRVLLDADLAALYGVTTKRLNQQVRRNTGRFPVDFAFQLSLEEANSLRLQNATLKTGRGRHRKYRPRVFTEYGAIMAATVLKITNCCQGVAWIGNRDEFPRPDFLAQTASLRHPR